MSNEYTEHPTTGIKLTVLVVEDEEAIASMLRYNLLHSGYDVRCVHDGEEALVSIYQNRPDVILLDWMLPGISGLEFCKKVRADESMKSIPIIMVTAKGEEVDKIEGLESGVDDYIVKPFSPKELLARIKAVLRRSRPAYLEKSLRYAGIEMNLANHDVHFNGKFIKLGPTEFKILHTMLEYPKRVYSREYIMAQVWPDIYVEPRTVDVHINRLRNAFKMIGFDDIDVVRTIRSAGYTLSRIEEEGSNPY